MNIKSRTNRTIRATQTVDKIHGVRRGFFFAEMPSRDGYREYKSCGKVCESCPYLEQCTLSKNHVKLVTRHIWEDYMEVCDDIRCMNLKKLARIKHEWRLEMA